MNAWSTLKLRVAACVAGLALAGALSACGSGGGSTAPAASVPDAPPPAPTAADVTMLFMGNSHTSVHNVPGIVAALLRAARPAQTVEAQVSPAWMLLNARGDDLESLALLGSKRWTVVVLQAQDYSSSGQFVYPTTGAEKLVRLAREQGAKAVLFAEWPRQGIPESGRIYETYASIARVQPACLPPIPQAFDLAALRHPGIALHDADGNHSAPAGAFLAALLLFAAIDTTPVESLANLPGIAVDPESQRLLRLVARDAAAAVSPRNYCGG
ncbi:MAG: hypothetical protein JNK75_07025 [Betaproteobacteria bacterium]|nr:hypothetical protein [Betaproteobacteria bacterium]